MEFCQPEPAEAKNANSPLIIKINYTGTALREAKNSYEGFYRIMDLIQFQSPKRIHKDSCNIDATAQ